MEKREKSSRKFIIIIFIPFLIFVLLQFFAPLVLETGSVEDLSGYAGPRDNQDKIDNFPFPFNALYDWGDVLCHQKVERSFILNENQMPFCARCFAIFTGMTLGLAFLLFYRVNIDEKFIYIIAISIAPIAIDGFGQLLGYWESTNLIRSITGLLIGFVCGIAIGIIIDELREIYLLNKNKN
jgi:uncharacterized membrane protein